MWELFSFGKFRLQTNITKLTKCRRKKKRKKKNTWYMFTKEKTLMDKLLPGFTTIPQGNISTNKIKVL